MYTYFSKKERITFHIHNNLCRGFFEKGVGADSVPLIGYAVYDLIYHTKLYTGFSDQPVSSPNLLLVDLYKKKKKRNRIETETKCINW